MSELMKIIDERERQKTKTERNKKVTKAIAKVWGINDFDMRFWSEVFSN